MAATGISSANFRTNSRGFMTLLSLAACEWFLMFLMLVDAGLSHLLTKFACYCELQTPCTLCSRLDHIFGNEKPGCYRSLLCNNHREEISSTISCQIHDKLADVREMCEECFMSVAMQNKPSPESYKLMVGKLGLEFERCGFQSPLSTGICSCCNKPLRTKTNVQQLLQLTPSGLGASRANVKPPLSRWPGRTRLSHRDNLKRIRDRITGSGTSPRSGNTAETTLFHVGYSDSELDINSDSESEVPFSDDDERSSVNHKKFDSNEHFLAQWGQENIARTQSNKVTLIKQTEQASFTRPSLIDDDVNASTSNSFMRHDLGELNREKPDLRPITSFPELISLADVPSSSNIVEVPFDISPEILSELVSLNVPSLSNDSGPIDECKSAVTSKGYEFETGDSVKFDRVMNLVSTVLSAHQEELQKSDTCSSEGVQVIQSFASLDKIDSGYESADMSTVSEFEGENIIDRLKRQVDYDRKCMSSLYKELEEERNASAIATNQTMAMITRLQEEKAALHMEALQYLRMMEEQAEYDMDALEKSNDLLDKKEKKIQDLEAEVEFYRTNFQDESTVVNNLLGEMSNLKGKNRTVGINVPFDSRLTKISEENENLTDVKSSFLDLEDEKMYIARSLKNLERKIRQVSIDCSNSGIPNDVCSEKITNGVENPEGISIDRGTQIDHQQKFASTSNGSLSGHGRVVALVEENYCVSEENNDHFVSDRQKSSMLSSGIALTTLENEISDLNDRLEALEGDRDFLEHAFNSFQNGKDGLQFLQEIAHHLQDLRKAEFRRCVSFS